MTPFRWMFAACALTLPLAFFLRRDLGVRLDGLALLGGVLGDRFGHRRVFACGVWTCAIAFPLCGFAPDYGWLLAARVVQGAGTGMVYGTAPALVTLGLVLFMPKWLHRPAAPQAETRQARPAWPHGQLWGSLIGAAGI